MKNLWAGIIGWLIGLGMIAYAAIAYGQLCESYIPNSKEIRQSAFDNVVHITPFSKQFTYFFYENEQRKVVAMMVFSRLAKLTRLTWERNRYIYSVRIEIDEMICVNPIKDGYDLTQLRDILMAKHDS